MESTRLPQIYPAVFNFLDDTHGSIRKIRHFFAAPFREPFWNVTRKSPEASFLSNFGYNVSLYPVKYVEIAFLFCPPSR